MIVSNEMATWYMNSTASILTDVAGLVSSYGSTTSDHYPVFTRYMFCKLTPPADITVPAEEGKCGAMVNYSISTTMTCGTITTNYPPGSFFPVGRTEVTVSSTTGESSAFYVTVEDKEKPTVSAPQSITVNPSSLSGAVVTYTVTASDNCSGTPTVRQTAGLASGKTFPIGTTVNTFEVEDASGNTTRRSFSVTVRDPYCGNNKDDGKVYVCSNGNTNCVSVQALQTFLAKGAKLGRCDWYNSSATYSITTQKRSEPPVSVSESFAWQIVPNPFSRTASVRYTIPAAATVTIKMYDIAGREVSQLFRGERAAGTYTLTYHAATLGAGTYYCRIVATTKDKEYIQVQKLIRVK